MDKKDFIKSLKLLKQKKLEKLEKKNGHYVLVPGQAYLFYDIESETFGRGASYEVNIMAGYYTPDEYTNPHNTLFEYSIKLSNTISVEYNTRTDKIDPFLDITKKYNLKPYEDETAYFTIKRYTEVYKLPNKALHTERVSGIKQTLEDLKWAPVETTGIQFIGKKYRKSKKAFEETQKKHSAPKGGRGRKTRRKRQ